MDLIFKGSAMAQVIRLLPVAKQTRFNLKLVHEKFVVERVSMGVVFVSALWFCPVNTIPNNISHSPQSICYSYQKDNWVELGNLSKALKKSGRIECKCFVFWLSLKGLLSITYGTTSVIGIYL
jgi:hypothetical protein